MDLGKEAPNYLLPLTTLHEWDDSALDQSTRLQLEAIVSWTQNNPGLKPGPRCLFEGTSATDRANAAALLGKRLGVPVFRVDLSQVVSKYIGETEKNLARIFDRADGQSSILFFDEAETVFGERTDVHDAHDRYIHVEASYLLERIEGFAGLVILGFGKWACIEDALARRFPWIVLFPAKA
jgi:SpoVK/Ycf46/Vps4 family AAA+-type ATPase